ncbi:MAG: hypothetical protein OEW60_02630 [Thiovulaceae bacterium]|nr:hypothetical protein [Sulfurimonadaceae bacterium]
MKKYLLVISIMMTLGFTNYEKSPDILTAMKQTMLPPLEAILPMYSQLEHCYAENKSKENYIKCTSHFGPKVEKIIKTMLSKAGPDQEKKVSAFPSVAQLRAFNWNETIHDKTISSIKSVSKQMKKLKSCLLQSKTLKAFSRCSR